MTFFFGFGFFPEVFNVFVQGIARGQSVAVFKSSGAKISTTIPSVVFRM
jgi:hypothetical protein